MAHDEYLFTSESVTEGHPDKIADQISDAVLDAIMEQDPTGRVACECLLTTGLVVVAGEITTSCYVDIPRIARDTIKQVGYTRAKFGFDYETCGVIVSLDEQSSDIAMGVDRLGAGDQGLMFGYACTETPELMPAPISLAHALVRRLSEVRRAGTLAYLRPDGKSQVSVRYAGGKPVRVETVVISTQHSPDVTLEQLRTDVIEHVVRPTLPAAMLEDVILGTHGALAGMRPGAILIIMSTIDPTFCHRVAAAATARGVAVLDAPVSGGASAAAQGNLALLVGGDLAVIERVRPILEVMGRIVVCGDLGMGMVAKLANNAVLGGTIALVAEALTLTRAYGMPAASLLEAMRHSSGNSFVVHHWDELAAGWVRRGFVNVRKDVRLCLEAAHSQEVTMPMTTGTSQYPWDLYMSPQR